MSYRDKIRAIAMYEKLCIDKATEEPSTSLHQPSRDPRSDAFSSAVRCPWRRSDGKPTIRSSTSSQAFLGRYASVGHAGVTKRAAARLDSYDQVHKPFIARLDPFQARRDSEPGVGSVMLSTPVAAHFSELHLAKQNVSMDEGRESRRKDARR